MAGASTSTIRSAYVPETTAGTIPATPGFTTMHSAAMLTSAPLITSGRSLIAKGQRHGHSVHGIEVSGTLETPLIYGAFDDWLATLLQASWVADVLKNGVEEKTLTVEQTVLAGAGGTPTMLRFRGVEATGGTLSLEARSEASLNLTLLGRGSDDATTTAIVGATYADPANVDPITSGEDVGNITFAGFDPMDCIQSMEIAFTFEKREVQPRIGSNDLCGVTRGDFLPTITARLYVEDGFLALYNAARTGGEPTFAVTVPLGSVSGEKYTLVFPACRFGSSSIDMSGNSVMQAVEILPEWDSASGATLTITRAVV